MFRYNRLSFILISILFTNNSPVAAKSPARPHVLVILADDLAWSDLGCYGHTWHETPHLDRLAAAGMKFTDAYAAAPICSASRAALQTGQSTARLGFEFVTKNEAGRQKLLRGQTLRSPPFTLNLPLEETTIGELAAGAGYQTAFCGKWHLNAHHGRYLGWSPTHGPPQQGYQITSADFGSHPYSYKIHGNPKPITETGRYPQDALTEAAVDFLKRPHEKPFFLMVSHYYVHTPVKTPCQWLLKKYDDKIPPGVPNRKKRIAYAAFVETLDHYVGQLLTGLEDAGLSNETCVLFTSDNGGHPEYTGNAPLRGSKWNLYEGGIRVPFIARWPGQIPAGSTNATPIIGYDLLPTLATLTGTESIPHTDQLDGRDITPLWSKTPEPQDRPLFWHFPYYHPESKFASLPRKIGVNDFKVSQTRPHSALRRGNHKLLYFYEDQRTELYDLSEDVAEQHDLSGETPELTQELRQLLLDYLTRVDARLPTAANAD